MKSIEIKSGLDNKSVRTIIIDKVYDINCKEQRYDSSISTSYISNELHLYNMRYNSAKSKVITHDINLNYFASWDPIPSNPAGTTINGNYRTITGMRFSVPTGNMKNYGFVSENRGMICYLNFAGVSIIGKSADKYGSLRFGTVAVINYGTLSFCMVSGKIDVSRRDGVVGGIASINNKSGIIQNCRFGYTGSIDQNYIGNSGDLGGIVGGNYGGSVQYNTVQQTTLGGEIDNCSHSYGGIVGYVEGGYISGQVYGIHIKVTNSTLISGQYPSIGYIAGHIAGGAVVEGCVISDCSNYIKKLTVGYRKNCFKGAGGCYGVCSNGTVREIIVY